MGCPFFAFNELSCREAHPLKGQEGARPGSYAVTDNTAFARRCGYFSGDTGLIVDGNFAETTCFIEVR